MAPPSPFSIMGGVLRSILGAAERAETDVATHSPLQEAQRLEEKLEQAVAAAHRAAESLERHVAVVEKLADSLGPLSESVTRLTEQLNSLMKIASPVAAAEHELSRVERLFGRRHRPADTSTAGGGETQTPMS
ncbi:MAG: hypothetical protein JO206_08465 [Solirubrobacterales bacterium]|nr:hypothetical protein [Solirubrobacterales bacterium]